MQRVAVVALALTGLLGLLPTRALVKVARAERAEPPELAYTLDARLDPARHELEGRARIELTHHAATPLHDVVLHLYANAFESERTVFAREGGASLRGLPLERRGGIELRALTTQAGENLLARAERELVPDDRTQLRAPLPRPLMPGERLVLHAQFVVRLPSLVARMGQARDFCMIAQWFPKLARLGDDGAWRSTPYHGAAEFDADFADYTLTVDVPAAFVVAAPGEPQPQARAEHDGRRREAYVLRRARDLAWAASPELVRSIDARGAHRIEVYAPRGHSSLAEREAKLANEALARLGDWLGAYPHARLVVVLPPAHAAGAAGMEYAGLIVGASVRWSSGLPGIGLPAHDAVVAHELAHQWFPMLLSSDEVAAPWLDEGLAEWVGLQLLAARYPRATFERALGLPLDVYDLESIALAADPSAPSSLDAGPQLGLLHLGAAAYSRPALALERIARVHGRARLLRVFARYARAHRFAQVEPSDFFGALDAEYGEGFAARELVPFLEGRTARDALLALPTPAAVGPSHDASASVSATSRPSPPLLARLLLVAQALLGWVGP